MRRSSARLLYTAGMILLLVGLATGWVRRWNGGAGFEDGANGLAVDRMAMSM